MPRRDGTGPLGEGSLTGRGMGFCNPENGELKSENNKEDNLRQGLGRGTGLKRGLGMRRGLGRKRDLGRRGRGGGLDYRARVNNKEVEEKKDTNQKEEK